METTLESGRAPTKRLAGITLADITPPTTKKRKTNTVEPSASGSTESKNFNEKLTVLAKEQVDLVPSHSHKDPIVQGTPYNFQELRARHRYYLEMEEKAILDTYVWPSGFRSQ